MRRLPQSTAYTAVFKVFLSSDHVSAATGKTVAITLSKAGAAFGNPNVGAANATEIAGGWYKFALDTTDTGTLGDLVLVGTAASCDTADIIMHVVAATNGGMTAMPAVAASAIGGLLTAPTTANVGLSDLSRILGTALTETAGLLAGGFKKFFNVATPTGTLNSIPDAVPDASGGLPVTGNRLTAIPTIATVTTVTNQLTAAAIATGVWQDATAGDFTTASSIGKALYIANVVPGAAGGHFIAGTNAATSITTGLTSNVIGNVTGNLSGSVGSVTGAVGSVTGLTASDVGTIKTQTDKFVFTVTNQVDANVLDWKSATAPAMTGDAFARLGAPAGASVSADIAAAKVDTAAIKIKTDSLTFTVAGYLASDIRYVKGTLVTGAGTAGSPWGP